MEKEIKILLISNNRNLSFENIEKSIIFKSNNASESFEIIESKNPHIVIIDLSLENISGYELCRIIKNNYKLPIITIAEDNKISSVMRAQQEGADACLFLPFRENELKEIVEKIVGEVRN